MELWPIPEVFFRVRADQLPAATFEDMYFPLPPFGTRPWEMVLREGKDCPDAFWDWLTGPQPQRRNLVVEYMDDEGCVITSWTVTNAWCKKCQIDTLPDGTRHLEKVILAHEGADEQPKR